MRSKLTNILQISILITAIIYILFGLTFFVMPYYFGKVLSINVPEEWAKLLVDQLQVFLYIGINSFAILLVVTGLAMILPLFDPLKYRGLVYFNGVIFPLMLIAFLIKNWIRYKFNLALIISIVFLFILLINYIGLAISRREAKEGIE